MLAIASVLHRREHSKRGIDPTAVHLESSLEEEEGALVIRYVLRNESTRDLVVFNRIPVYVYDGSPRYWSTSAYKGFDAGDLSVELMVLPVPADIHQAPTTSREWAETFWKGNDAAPMPDVTLLEAGGAMEGRVVLREPVKVRDWYKCAAMERTVHSRDPHDENSADQWIDTVTPGVATTISFSIGASAFTGFLTRASATYSDVYEPPHLVGDQIVLTKTLVPPRPVPVFTCGVVTGEPGVTSR